MTMDGLNPATFDLSRFLSAEAPVLDFGWEKFEKKIYKYMAAVSYERFDES